MKTVEVLAKGLDLNAAVVRTLEVGLKGAKLVCKVSVGTDYLFVSTQQCESSV